MGWPEWNGSDIAALSLHRPANFIARLDFLPFVALYAGWAGLCWQRGFDRGIITFGAVSLMVVHIVLFLMQYWSLRVRVLVGFRTVKSIGAKDEEDIRAGNIRVRAVPPPHNGKSDFVTLMMEDRRIHFTFQMRSYEYNFETGKFEQVVYPEHLTLQEYSTAIRKAGGLSEDEIFHRMVRYGTNRIEIPLPKFWDLYKEQLLSPFFVFQVFCILLWLMDSYWQYSALTMGMMLFFEAIVVKGRLKSLTELRGMRNRPSKINAYRNKKWVVINSMELLPGDVVSLTRGATPDIVVPCDCLIISGGAVVNEAMLTGESVPLMKEGIDPVSEKDLNVPLDIASRHKGHVLFGGTRILTQTSASVTDATPPSKAPDNGCICIVLRTGFGSSQGVLLRTILASTERVTANSWESAMFILFLVVFALLASAYVLVEGMKDETRDQAKLLLHCVMIITSVIPPELPMQLALAVNSSLIALAREFVFCTEPFRIPFAGKIDVCCFDKTGTLTTDNIRAVGVAMPSRTVQEFSTEEYELLETNQASLDAAFVMAGCHSLVFVDNELAGDPLELAALNGVEWNYSRSEAAFPRKGNSGAGLKILTRFRFLSQLQRMSTVVQVQEAGNMNSRALVKGSPEAIGKLLAKKPEHYDATALSLARRGLRVLALAYKDIDASLTPSELKSITREQVEKDILFAGFVAFECPLRPESRKTIRNLQRSSHRVVMITGDATLTAVHVGKEVAIVGKKSLCLEYDGSEQLWKSAGTGRTESKFDVNEMYELSKKFDLAVPGFALDDPNLGEEGFKSLVKSVKIFARMTPQHKERVLTCFKDLGFTTLMCGDGTNDVGALKQAHIGVALLSYVGPERQQPQAPALRGAGPEALKMQKRAELVVAKGKTKKKGSSSQTKAPEATAPSKNGTAQAKKALKPEQSAEPASESTPPEPEEDLSHLTPEERRQKELKKMLNKQLKELDDIMAEDGPKVVKLGDASIASPFTSKKMTIDSCTVIIRQGRCTLSTTLQMYQILALNCLISAYSLSVLYLDGVKFGDLQMTFSGVLIAGAFFLITRASPLKALSAQRPAGNVFHPSLFLSLIAQFIVHLVCLAFTVQSAKTLLPKDYEPDLDGPFQPNILNTIVFLISTAQQAVVFAVNYKGFPFMQGLKDNTALKNTLLAQFVIVIVLALEVLPEMNTFVQLLPLPHEWLRYEICMWIAIDALGCYLVDLFFVTVFKPKAKKI